LARRYRKRRNKEEYSIGGLLFVFLFFYFYDDVSKYPTIPLFDWLLLMKGPIFLLILILSLYVGFQVYRVKKTNHILRTSGIGKIDNMTGTEFEKYLEVYFKDMGYKVETIGGSGDGGADLILISTEGNRICVQAKRWENSVGFKAIQEVFTAKALYNCSEAWVVTNNAKFSKQARETAKKLEVVLWDREKLIEHMYLYNQGKDIKSKPLAGQLKTYVALYDSNVFHGLECENGRNIARKSNILKFQGIDEAKLSGKRQCNCFR
jgi:restriction system protein